MILEVALPHENGYRTFAWGQETGYHTIARGHKTVIAQMLGNHIPSYIPNRRKYLNSCNSDLHNNSHIIL